MNKPKFPNEEKILDKEDWSNEHGNPSFKYLQALVKDGGPGAIEKLKSIAEDLNVEYDASTSSEELAHAKLSVSEDNTDNTA